MPKRRVTNEVEEVIYERCCGMDVHKVDVVACLNIDGAKEVRTFSTMTLDLLEMVQWLKEHDVQMVAMESTGSYWKPVYNILESEAIPAILVNPQHIRSLSGPKTDVRDSRWISSLLRHGLLKASFVPDRSTRELRELVKYRASLSDESTRTLNRIDKVLQGANIKLTNVISTTDTKTGLAILGALVEGVNDPSLLAELAQGTLQNKKGEIKAALNGVMGEHQRFLLKSMHNRLKQTKEEIAILEEEIDKRMEKDREIIDRLDEIPGVGKASAQAILAEIGTNMDQFPSEAHLASWAGVSPNQNESGGKRKSGKTKKGNSNLKKTLVRCANSASRVKKSYLSAQYKRIALRRGSNRAKVAVAHSILTICYYMIMSGACYEDLGSDFFDQRNREAVAKRSIKRLESLGYAVSIVDRDSGELMAAT